MAFDFRVISIGMVAIFVAMFTLFYIFDNIYDTRKLCETNKNLKICKVSSVPIALLMLLLIVGGLIVVVNVTVYIMISGSIGTRYVGGIEYVEKSEAK